MSDEITYYYYSSNPLKHTDKIKYTHNTYTTTRQSPHTSYDKDVYHYLV